MLRESAILAVGYLLFLLGRLLVEGERSQAFDHAARLLRFEQRAWFSFEADLQDLFLQSGFALDLFTLAWFVLPIPLLMVASAWLLLEAPVIYLRVRSTFGISALIALIVYWLFPTARPSDLPYSGVIDVPALRDHSGLVVNPHAAMPAVQAGWVLVAGVAVIIAARPRWWRWLIPAPIGLVLLAAIVTGEHLVLDLLVGGVLALAVLAMCWHQARFRRWWRQWMVPEPDGPSMLATLRADRWAALTVVSLAALTVYLSFGRLIDPGFTDYWFYMMAQILATIGAVVWLTHRFGPENGLHPVTLFIVVLVTYLDTLGTASDFYARYDVYDKITHTGGGAILAAVVVDLVASLRQRGAIGWRRSRQVTLAILVSILLGALWELYEFAGDAIFHTGRHSGRIDTLYDLISDSAGAILAALLLAWVFHRAAPAQSFQPGANNGPVPINDPPPKRSPARAMLGLGKIKRRIASRDRLLRCSLLSGVLAPFALGVTVFVGGRINPGYSHTRDTISDLWEQGRAHAEFVMVGLLLAGLFIILFGAGLHAVMPGHPRDVPLALALYGVAIIGAGLFQDYASRPGRVLNLEGFLHNTWSWLAVGSLALCVLIVFWHASREAAWRPLLVISGVVLVLVTAAALAFSAAPSGSEWRGFSERMLFGAGCAWMMAVARTAALTYRSKQSRASQAGTPAAGVNTPAG